jgi:hypothetical protein
MIMMRLVALSAIAALTWLLVDDATYRRMRNWLRARFDHDAAPSIERLRAEATETADELRAVTLGPADAVRRRGG